MSKVLGNIHVWVFLVNSESVLLLALVKYMLYNHFTQNCIFLYFSEAKSPCFVTKNRWKSSYICVFILSKKRPNRFRKKHHSSGIFDRGNLPVETCPTPRWITFLIFYRLVYNKCSHFNELILLWSAYWYEKKFSHDE